MDGYRNTIIFKQDDPIDLAALIVELIVRLEKENFFENFLNDSIQQFDWETIVKDYEKYFSLLN